MPITRATAKRKLMAEKASDSPSQDTVPELKRRKKITSKKPREPSKKDAGKESGAPPNKVTFADTKTPTNSKSIEKATVLPARPIPKRPLTNSKSELGTAPGKVRGRAAASTTQSHRSRSRMPALLPALGAALQKSWQANISAGGHSPPPEWDAKAHYHDGHVFSDGTFVEDGQLCKPLPPSEPRKPSPTFRPIARPKSNFAAYEALFGGKGPSGLKATRAPAGKKHKDLLPPDLDAKLRASLGLADLALSRTHNDLNPRGRRQRDGLRKPTTALEGVVARADKVAAGHSDRLTDDPNPFTAPRSELLRAERIAAERKKHGLPTRPRASAKSGGKPPRSVPRRRGRTDVVSGDTENPLVGLLAEAEMQVAKRRAAEANAEEGAKEHAFARVTGTTILRRQDRMRREREAEMRDEELDAMRQEQLAQRLRRKEMAQAASERRIKLTMERRKRERGEELVGGGRPPLEGPYAGTTMGNDRGVRERRRRRRRSVSPDLSSSRRGKRARVEDEDTEGMAYEEDVEDEDEDWDEREM